MINRILLQMAVPVNLRGFRFLEVALALMKTEPEIKLMALYTRIGRQFSTSDRGAERQMRYAVERAWNQMPPEVRQEFFGNTVAPDGRPTTGVFLRAVLAGLERGEGRGAA